MSVYYEKLIGRIGVDIRQPHPFSILFDILYNTRFYATCPYDENRIQDVYAMMDEINATYHEAVPPVRGVSFLEILIVLVDRMHFTLLYSEHESSKYELFVELLSNTGLNKYTDNYFFRFNGPDESVGDITDRIINRTYNKDGSGGLFPIRNKPHIDFRTVDLHYQMEYYICEKFDYLH